MINLEELSFGDNTQPWFLYKRVQLNTPTGYCFFTIEYGFWYLLRKVHVKYAEVDAAGAVFGPRLTVEALLRGTNKWPQNVPIPIDLISTPNQAGVQLDAATNLLTATPPKASKLLNTLYPFRDNIEFYITGQDVPGNMPQYVDFMAVGYLIPEKTFHMWEKEGGE